MARKLPEMFAALAALGVGWWSGRRREQPAQAGPPTGQEPSAPMLTQGVSGPAAEALVKAIAGLDSSALDGYPNLVWVAVFPAARLAYWNHSCERLLQRSASELSALPGDWEAWVHPDDLAQFRASRASLIEKAPSECVYRVQRGDGSWAWIRERVGLSRSQRANQTHMLIGVAEDASQEKRQEEELDLLEFQLLQSQKMQAVGQLASGVAHDLGNLLSVVRWHCDTVGASLPSGDPIHQSLDSVRTAVEAAATLSRSLVSFARNVRGQKRPGHLRHNLIELLPTIQRLIGQRIRIETDLGAEPGPLIHADQTQIQQVLLNLILNSRDAMTQGGVIRLNLGQDDQSAWLDVIDNGPGVAPALRPFVFEPFFTTKSSSQGTGLGLAIVQRILQEHGGRAELREAPGGGAWMRLWLPIWHPDIPVQANRPQPRVLLIHAVAQHRAVLAADLLQAGFAVVQAPDLRRAEELLAAPLPRPSALVLVESDRQSSAPEMLARLRSLGVRAPALLVLRGTPESAPAHRSTEPGVCVLHFPLAVIDLVTELEGLLGVDHPNPRGRAPELDQAVLSKNSP